MTDAEEEFWRVCDALLNSARSWKATPAHLEQVLRDLRANVNEPTIAEAVTAMLDDDFRARRYHQRGLHLLIHGIPGYVGSSGAVPAVPGLAERRISTVDKDALRRLADAVQRRSAEARVAAGRPLVSYDPDALGHGAEANFLAAVRALFARGDVRRWATPHPTKGLSPRRGGADHAVHISPAQYRAWLQVACSTGDDRELDRLLLLFLGHTGVRQEAVVNLTLDAIDIDERTVRTSQKDGRTHVLPVNGQLLGEIVDLARRRGARVGRDPAFLTRRGLPVSGRRFDTITKRLKRECPWAAPLNIGPHAIRRLVATQVADQFGPHAAKAWAGHVWRDGDAIYHYISRPRLDRLREMAAVVFGPLDAPLPPESSPGVSPFDTAYGLPSAPAAVESSNCQDGWSTTQPPVLLAAAIRAAGRAAVEQQHSCAADSPVRKAEVR